MSCDTSCGYCLFLQSKSQAPLHKIAAGGSKSSVTPPTVPSSRDKSGGSDRKQSSGNISSKTVVKRGEVGASDIVVGVISL